MTIDFWRGFVVAAMAWIVVLGVYAIGRDQGRRDGLATCAVTPAETTAP